MATNQKLTQFVVWAPDYGDAGAQERRLAVRPRHLENAHQLTTQGIIRKHRPAPYENRLLTERVMEYTGVGAGVLTSDSANATPADRKFFGSCLIVEADSLEAAHKLIESDIYYTAGVVRTILSVGCVFFLNRGMTSGTRKSYRSFRS